MKTLDSGTFWGPIPTRAISIAVNECDRVHWRTSEAVACAALRAPLLFEHLVISNENP